MWHSAAKLPAGSGRYRLDGFADGGSRLFSLSFDPDPLSHGGSSFLFAVPFDSSWDAALDRIVFSGPEGSVMVDRSAGDRAGIVTGADGRIRSIVRELSPDVIAVLQADASDGMRIVRGLPRPR